MAAEQTILLVGDFITDRTWLVGEPSLLERHNSHFAIHPHTLVDPARETDVAGGVATIARAIGAVSTAKVVAVGAWSYYVTNEFARGRLIPPEGELRKRPIDFRQAYESEFTSVKTRVFLPEPGGARLRYRFDRNSNVSICVDPKNCRKIDWPDPEEVSAIVLGDYGYGVLHLPHIREGLKQYANRRTPIILRSSASDLVTSLTWDVLVLNLHHCANLIKREPFDLPVTKQIGSECTYHPSLVTALQKMSDEHLSRNGVDRALLLNLESEGALILHNGRVDPYLLAAKIEDDMTGIGANDVLLAHFVLGMLENPGDELGDRLRAGSARAVRASAAFVAHALQLETMPDWNAPKAEVTDNDIERATPILQRPYVLLNDLEQSVANARNPLLKKQIHLRDAGWYLDGFHTVDPDFGEEIVRLKMRIKEYVESHAPKRPFLAVLCGDPGAGKSTLAEALGHYSGCQVISSNAAQWTSTDELFDLCEQIRSARMLGKKPLVFIDEVDTNEELYPKLLAPVWDGTYSIKGQVRALGTPTVFLLAGSDGLWRNSEELLRGSRKGKKLEDLVSRLTIRPLQIPPLEGRAGDVAYLIGGHITRKFPRVNAAANGIFELILRSKCSHGARSIATVIDKFGPLQQERFLSTADLRNWDADDLALHLQKIPKDWSKDEARVDITL